MSAEAMSGGTAAQGSDGGHARSDTHRPGRYVDGDSGSGGVAHAWHLAVPAVISVATFLVIDLLLATLVGRTWGPAYPLTMDALVIARMGPLFFSGLVVWPAMRARGASRGQATIGILATPLAFAIVSGWRATAFFPPLEAAYYATNPIVVGALGAQVSSAGVGALAYALWRARRARVRASASPMGATALARAAATGRSRPWSPLVAIVAGTAVTVVAVLWDGGQHLFYPWVLLYGRLFG